MLNSLKSFLAELEGQSGASTSFSKLRRLFASQIRSGFETSVSIRHINDQVGWGVFAESKLPAGSFVGVYTGLI
jgi:SET domain-containing protein